MNTTLSDQPAPCARLEGASALAIPNPGTQASTDQEQPPGPRVGGSATTEAATPTDIGPEETAREASAIDQGPAQNIAATVGEPAAPAIDQRPPPIFDIGALGKVDQLSPEEYMALLTDEQIIQNEFEASIDVGQALADIRDRGLYRVEYRDFPDYYRQRWHLDTKRVHFLTATAATYRAITKDPNLPKPDYAYQLRPLLVLDADKARQAWELAAKKAGGGRIRVSLVQAAVVELKLRPEALAQRMELRRERAEQREQLTQAMDMLLEMIVTHKSYEELVQTAALLDRHVRFFFPKRKKR